jgi:hypothetical protein
VEGKNWRESRNLIKEVGRDRAGTGGVGPWHGFGDWGN